MPLSHGTPVGPLLFVSLVVSGAAPLAQAQKTIHVPADQPSIQAGINAASNGDTVLVAPGKYTENIDFKGKAITVASSAGPAQTIIDGGQNGVVATFQTFETRASVLNGFTLTDNAPPYPSNFPVVAAGILVVGANPTITSNVITGNRGYGIDLTNSGALISGNTISDTLTAYDPSQDFGCDLIDGSGIYIFGGKGAENGNVEILNNIIEFNTARCYGGAIYYDYAADGTLIANNTFRYNAALGPGGAVYVYASLVSFVQNLFIGNMSGAGGGAIYLQIPNDTNANSGPLNQFLVNNTFVGNSINANPNIENYFTDGSQVGFGGYVSQVGFFNNIIVSGDGFGQIACDPTYQYLSGNPPVSFNNDSVNFGGPRVGGWCPDQTGTNANIGANPMFVTANNEPFHLQTGSPALGVGEVSAQDLPQTDLNGNPRTQDGKVDLGVYEGAVTSTASGNPGFSLSSSPASLTIPNNESAQVTLTISPTGGFIGALSVSCPTAPSGITCSFSSPILASGGDNQQLTTMVTISASVSAVALVSPPLSVSQRTKIGSLGFAMAFTLLYFAAIYLFSAPATHHKRRNFSTPLCLTTLVAIGLLMQSCGGGSQSSSTPPPPPNSQSFNLSITVSSSGNASPSTRTLNLPLTITL
jgi:parallel beta-helix repeat protein